MTDALLTFTPDGLEMQISQGVVAVAQWVESAIVLSFIGNSDDPGLANASRQYWANLLARHSHQKLRSEFAHLADGLPITSGNLRKMQEAAERDLAWMTEPGPNGVPLAESAAVTVRSPERYVVNLSGSVVVRGVSYPFSLTRRVLQ